MRLSTRLLLVVLITALATPPRVLAQSVGEDPGLVDLIESPVAEEIAMSSADASVQLANLKRDEAYVGHSFVRLRSDLSQVRALRLYVDPETRQPVTKRGNPNAVEIVVARTSVISQGEDGYAWTGELREAKKDGAFLGEVFLFVTGDGQVSGTFHVTDEVFLIESIGPQASMIVSLDENARLDADDGAAPEPRSSSGADWAAPTGGESTRSGTPPARTSSSTSFDHRLLVLYTPDVATRSGLSIRNIERRIQQEALLTNMAYDASQIDEFDLEVVAIRQYSSLNETNSTRGNLAALQGDAGVRALRDQYRADLVLLVTWNGDAPGAAYVNATSQSQAYSVVRWGAFVGANAPGYTFAHELGHNQGAEHHPNDVQSGGEAFDYSFGHRFRDRDCFIFCSGYSYYSTILAYTSDTGNSNQYVRVPRFSNPDIRYDDQPTGINNARDNARTLENTASRIANLFQSPFAASIGVFTSNAPYKGSYTLTANTSGSESASSYRWYLSSSPSSYGSVRSTSRTMSQYLDVGTWYAKLVVQGSAGTTLTKYRTIEVLPYGGGDPCLSSAGGGVSAAGIPICPELSEQQEGEVALQLALTADFSVAPNPMREQGRVSITLEEAGAVDLSVFDALGQQVRKLSASTLAAGSHAFDLDTGTLPPGVYVVRLVVDETVSTRRVTVVR